METSKQIRNNRHGFTIVELLIVIVVIAILAAISIVAYNGVQDRARTSAARQVSDAVALYTIDNGESYPPSLADVDKYYRILKHVL